VIETIEMLEQETTYPNVEFILIDDGSKDKTGILLEAALASGKLSASERDQNRAEHGESTCADARSHCR
jgi:glycosyltransferase involved in cell wall biosynthesis